LNQATIQKEIQLSGVGLHTGEEVTVRLKPADANRGISFIRTDLAESPTIPVSSEFVIATERETTVGQGEVAIHTVEHLLSACGGLGVDNLLVEIDGPEIPIFDGSSLPFVNAIQEAGIKRYNEPARVFRVREPVWMEDGAKSILVVPCSTFKVSYTIHFPTTGIGSQFMTTEITPEFYAKEIAPARTFCTYEDVEQLRAAGLIKGGSLENALVYDANGPYKGCQPRFPDEPVRHKILDLIGDMMFLGSQIMGHVIVIRGGHSINVRMTRKLGELRQKTVAHYHRSLSVANEQLDIQAIKKILPHRYPFLLIDRILSIEGGKKIVGLKNVTGNEDFFNGHFPQYPIMPGVLILEAMAQVGGVMLLSGADMPGRLVFFMGLDNVKFRRPVVPGDQVIFEVEAVKIRSRTGMMRGQAFVEGHLVAEADLKFSIPEE
jgi:UDP-3-O-[3-hydroxymyristoyl] N-acetylglucosamine deacetylase / 3-hydroxyacyl-[acyl-carrier-protein] dehydratase